MAFLNCGNFNLIGGHPKSSSSSMRNGYLGNFLIKSIVTKLNNDNDKDAFALLERLFNHFGFQSNAIPFFDSQFKCNIE